MTVYALPEEPTNCVVKDCYGSFWEQQPTKFPIPLWKRQDEEVDGSYLRMTCDELLRDFGPVTVCAYMPNREKSSSKLFQLIRTIDITGISGTGVVAEGVEFSDGTVAIRRLDSGVSSENRKRGVRPTTVVHESIESVIALHGHNGASVIEYI